MNNTTANILISSDGDIIVARQKGRELAAQMGFGEGDRTVIAAAISEVARNIVLYARRGQIEIRGMNDRHRRGLTITARDEGPGIRDVGLALQDGYSTGEGFGLGLPGAKRLMDEFTIDTRVGGGTTVVMRKWVR